MNIVFYSSIYFTDCDFALIREYQAKGINVTYYIQVIDGRQCGGLLDLRSYNLAPGIYPAKRFAELKIYENYLDLSNTFIVWRRPRLSDVASWNTYLKLYKAIKRKNPAVLHIAGELGVSESLLYFFRKRIVQTVHDPFMHSGERSSLAEYKRRISYKMVNKLVLLNENQKREFLSTYGISKNKVFSNRLGVYTALNYLLSLSKDKETNFSAKYILFFGHISPYKGIDTLCKAMLNVHEHLPELKCIIAGKGKLYFDFKPYEQLNYIILKNHFISTEELAVMISESLFTVCPYKDATQSGVVASSFALAKPVLATNVGGLGESVIDGITGKLVHPNDSDALAKAIIDMVNSNGNIEKYSNNIKKLFWEGDMSWSDIANKYIEIYEAEN